MFPPNNPHYPRNRSCTRCLNGTKRKGLYAVFTIGIFLCIIFAVNLMCEHHVLDVSKQHVLGTMHQSYNAESPKFVNESRRRMPDPAQEAADKEAREQSRKDYERRKKEILRNDMYDEFKSVLRVYFIMYPTENRSGDPIHSEDPKWEEKASLAFEGLLKYYEREDINDPEQEDMIEYVAQLDPKVFGLRSKTAFFKDLTGSATLDTGTWMLTIDNPPLGAKFKAGQKNVSGIYKDIEDPKEKFDEKMRDEIRASNTKLIHHPSFKSESGPHGTAYKFTWNQTKDLQAEVIRDQIFETLEQKQKDKMREAFNQWKYLMRREGEDPPIKSIKEWMLNHDTGTKESIKKAAEREYQKRFDIYMMAKNIAEIFESSLGPTTLEIMIQFIEGERVKDPDLQIHGNQQLERAAMMYAKELNEKKHQKSANTT